MVKHTNWVLSATWLALLATASPSYAEMTWLVCQGKKASLYTEKREQTWTDLGIETIEVAIDFSARSVSNASRIIKFDDRRVVWSLVLSNGTEVIFELERESGGLIYTAYPAENTTTRGVFQGKCEKGRKPPPKF